MKTSLLILFCTLLLATVTNAQTFTNLHSGFPTLTGAAVAWADYDNDGDLDFAFNGFSGVTAEVTLICRNDGNGNFTYVDSDLAKVSSGSVNWGDYDNDGDQDFFITGGTLSASAFPECGLYINDGSGNFSEDLIPLTDLSTGTAKWGDYDNDGDLDLLYDGIDSTFGAGITVLYRNDGAGNFTLVNANLPGTGEPGSVDWGDVDNDGDLDILLGGDTYLLRNDGNDVFTDITPPDFDYGVPNSFADVDNDGDLDFLAIQVFGGNYASTIWRNDLIAASVNTFSRQDLQCTLFPNPCTDFILLQFSSLPAQPISFTLFNILGEKVYSAQVTQHPGDRVAITLPALESGMYFYVIEEEKNVVGNGKLSVD